MTTYILNESGEWVEGEPTENGQRYKVVYADGGSIESIYSVPVNLDTYSTSGEVVQINGNEAQGKATVYFGMNGDSLTITVNIVDGNGDIQTQIDQDLLDYPSLLMLPLVKVAGSTVVDELYLVTTIHDGVIVANGAFPSGGNWQLSQERVNAALNEIAADWQIKMNLIQFRVA